MAEPLLLASSGENFIRFLFTLIVFAAVLVATFFVSKWTAGYQKMRMTDRNFEVIDSMRVSSSKYIMIVRIGQERYFAIAVGKDEMTLLGELSGDEVIRFDTDSGMKSGRGKLDFNGLLNSFSQPKETSEHHED